MARSASAFRRPPLMKGAARWKMIDWRLARLTLNAMLLDRINPSTRRSSGTKPTPDLTASAGLRGEVGLSFEGHRALLRSVNAKQESSQLRPSCADEAPKSKDLALPQNEAHAFDPWRAGKGAYGKSRLAGGSSVRPLRRCIDDAANDRLNHRLPRHVRAC